jgi:hypothetical protein
MNLYLSFDCPYINQRIFLPVEFVDYARTISSAKYHDHTSKQIPGSLFLHVRAHTDMTHQRRTCQTQTSRSRCSLPSPTCPVESKVPCNMENTNLPPLAITLPLYNQTPATIATTATRIGTHFIATQQNNSEMKSAQMGWLAEKTRVQLKCKHHNYVCGCNNDVLSQNTIEFLGIGEINERFLPESQYIYNCTICINQSSFLYRESMRKCFSSPLQYINNFLNSVRLNVLCLFPTIKSDSQFSIHQINASIT